MKQFFFTFMVLVLTATGTGKSSCITCLDSVPTDTALFKKVYQEVAAPLVDSLVNATRAKVEEVRSKRDSLCLIVDSMYQDKFKREVTLQVDTWRSPDNKLHVWSWRFLIYPNGDTLYYRMIKKPK